MTAVTADETFDGTWPFRARYTDALGFQMHYVDEGAGPETLLLLHGEPTWGYLFRHQIPVWAARHRVIAVDHMGFGKSAVPQDRTYWLQDHIDNLERVVLALDLRDLTLVMHDFGGPAGMGLAIRHPDRIKCIVSVDGPTPAGQPDLIERITANIGESSWFKWIVKAESEGVLEQILGQLDYNILSTLKLNGFERNEIIGDTWLRAYRAPFPTPAHATGAIGWAKGSPMGPTSSSSLTLPPRRSWQRSPRWRSGAKLIGPSTASTSCLCSARLSPRARSTACLGSATTARRTPRRQSHSWCENSWRRMAEGASRSPES